MYALRSTHYGPEYSQVRYSSAKMNFVVMMLVVHMAWACERSTDHPCDDMYFKDLQMNICNVTRPYEEFCFSGCCTYLAPTALLKHLKKKHCEVTWYTPDMRCLADPSHPMNLSDPAVNVTLKSLTTKQHVDGLFINIDCHDTNKQYRAVYRVMCNTSASPTSAPPPDQTKFPIIQVAVGVPVAILVIVAAVALSRCHRQIYRQICGGEDLGEEGVRLRGGQITAAAVHVTQLHQATP